MKSLITSNSTLAGIGGRLRAERERLCLSQALFSGKVGVARMTQVNYESGKRSPDAVYLLAACEAGVDIGFVVTGKRTAAPDFFRMATVFVLESIQKQTGFAEDVLSFVIEAIAEAAAGEWLAESSDQGEGTEMADWIPLGDLDCLITALNKNAGLLRDIFGTLNNLLAFNPSLRLEGRKRLGVVMMLFRAFYSSGEVDREVVENATRLAST